MPGVEPKWEVRPIIGGLVSDFSGPNYVLAVQHDRVTFRPTSIAKENLEAVETGATTLLRELPRTPVSAAGINFGFDAAADASATLQGMFTLSDEAPLREAGIPIEKRIIRTQLTIDHDQRLTVILTRIPGAAEVSVDMNYQRQSAIAQDVADMPAMIGRRMGDAINFLRTVYGLVVDE